MLMWNPSKLTTAGKALLAKAQAGQTSIQITKAQTGSGSYSSGENIEGRTALKTPKQTFPIQNKVISDAENTVILKIAITNKSETETLSNGYDITEFGIFAKDPQKGEILYSIATASTSDYMPAYNGVLPSVINMSYYLEVSNAANVTINSAGALALQADLEALESRVATIEQAAVKKYGARKKVSQQSCGMESWERLGGAVGLTAKAVVGTGEVQNDFMKSVYPYNACRPCNIKEDGTVTAYLGDANFSWDGSSGDVMLEMPLCYTSRYFETDNDGVEWEYRWVSSAPVDGLHVNPAFTDGSSISDKIYIPIFNGSAGKDAATGVKDVIRSIAGATPLTEATRATFRTRSRNKGENWQLDDVWDMFLLDHLFIIMFAGTQAQRILGAGRTGFRENGDDKALKAKTGTNCITIASDRAAQFFVGQQIAIGTALWNHSVLWGRTITAFQTSTEVEAATDIYFDGDPVDIAVGNVIWSCVQKTGETTAMKCPNGCLEDPEGPTGVKLGSRRAVRFLWIEDWFGNMWQFRDGVNIKNRQHYCCNKRASYADDTYTGDYQKLGYVCPTNEGYIKKMGFDSLHPEYELPVEVGGGADSYVGDYYYSSEGGTLVISGGHVTYGASAGPFSRACYYGTGNTNWAFGGRPHCRKAAI
uniref:Tail collar fiber protein n=1 Tax=Myoviridae sp. ctp7F23 TaxID=2825174 RepID=A0A8S5U8I3_9CAUD|nr:MAG TPA: tail collar fiber protein [Myoviridae sp. ctp7F23]